MKARTKRAMSAREVDEHPPRSRRPDHRGERGDGRVVDLQPEQPAGDRQVPVLDTGRNSVSPSTTPRMTASTIPMLTALPGVAAAGRSPRPALDGRGLQPGRPAPARVRAVTVVAPATPRSPRRGEQVRRPDRAGPRACAPASARGAGSDRQRQQEREALRCSRSTPARRSAVSVAPGPGDAGDERRDLREPGARRLPRPTRAVRRPVRCPPTTAAPLPRPGRPRAAAGRPSRCSTASTASRPAAAAGRVETAIRARLLRSSPSSSSRRAQAMPAQEPACRAAEKVVRSAGAPTAAARAAGPAARTS
jgi:hypothetical protein